MRELFSKQGTFLFRWRSYLPIIMAVPLAIALFQMRWPLESHAVHIAAEVACFLVSMLGLAIRVMTVGHTPEKTSGRNTYSQIANSLNTSGMYSLVRHPLYLGNFLIGLGPMLLPLIWWLPILYILAFALYYERIMFTEESFLNEQFGGVFKTWASKTPAFIPKLHGWVTPSLPFSLRNVLKREYTAFAQICLGFTLVEFAEHWIIDRKLELDPVWITIACFGILQYVLFRSLKRYSSLLDVAGR